MLREVKHWYALTSPTAAGAAAHPGARHIVALLEVAYTEYEHWMVMPKAIGNLRDARAKLLEDVDESVHEALIYPRFVHLINALDYMHSRGFVHLDVRCAAVARLLVLHPSP
jgi:serine/threonine protein kinase